MKVVVDTNVLVSGFLTTHSSAAEVADLILDGDLTVCHDARILVEYREVLLRPKFSIDRAKVEALLMVIEKEGHATVGKIQESMVKDPDDRAFLEVAIGGGARYLITGNISDFPRQAGGVEVIPPRRFMGEWRMAQKNPGRSPPLRPSI